MKSILYCVAFACLIFLGCGKPLATATVSKDIFYFSKEYNTDSKDVIAALKDVLKNNGYSIASEDTSTILTTWAPTTSDSHFVEVFGRKDFGANGAYYQLEARVSQEGGSTHVEIGSRVKAVAAGIKSTGIEERRLLSHVTKSLRKTEPDLTNIGLEE